MAARGETHFLSDVPLMHSRFSNRTMVLGSAFPKISSDCSLSGTFSCDMGSVTWIVVRQLLLCPLTVSLVFSRCYCCNLVYSLYSHVALDSLLDPFTSASVC
jgi:hypothetical protein